MNLHNRLERLEEAAAARSDEEVIVYVRWMRPDENEDLIRPPVINTKGKRVKFVWLDGGFANAE